MFSDRHLNTTLHIANDGSRSSALVGLSKAAALTGDFPEALRIADRNVRYKSQSLQEIAVALAQRGEAEEGERLARSIEDPFYRSMAFWRMARIVAKAGDFDLSHKIVSLIEKSDHQALARIDIAESRGRQDADIARREYEDLRDYLKLDKSGFDKDGRIFLALIKSMARAGFIAEANDNLASLTKQNQRDDVLTEIAVTIAGQGDIEKAFSTLNFVQDNTTRDRAGAAIAWKLADTGNLAASLEIAKALSDREQIRDRVLTRIVSLSLFRNGNVEQANAIISLIQSKDGKARAMVSLAKFQMRQGDLEEARQYAAKISAFFGAFDLRADFAIEEARRGNFSASIREAMNLDSDSQPVRKALSEGERIRALSEIARQLAVGQNN